MEGNLNCPACGAEIAYAGAQERIRCEFCGTELRVMAEEGETRLRVVSQPEPQTGLMAERANQQLSEELERGTAAPVSTPPTPEMTGPGGLAYPAAAEAPALAAPLPAPPYQAGRSPAGAGGSGNTTRWIAIGAAVFVGACLLVACVAGVLVLSPFLMSR
jgi:hypothetical protein